MTTSSRMRISGLFCSPCRRFLEFKWRNLDEKVSAADAWSVFDCRRWRRKTLPRGLRRHHVVGNNLLSRVMFRRRCRLWSLTRFMFPSGSFPRLSAIGCFALHLSKTPNSTKLRLCGSPPTISPASSPVRRSIPTTLLCRELLSDLNVETVTQDERNHGEPLNVAFQGTLRTEQQAAANAMAAHDI